MKPTKGGAIITATHIKGGLTALFVGKKLSYKEEKVVPARLRLTKVRNVNLSLAGKIKKGEGNIDVRVGYALLGNLDIGARGVPLALVQHPAPLQKVGTGSTTRDLEASTTSLMIDVSSWHAVREVQFGNCVLE